MSSTQEPVQTESELELIIPKPSTWSFPLVVVEALRRCSKNGVGRDFGPTGTAYGEPQFNAALQRWFKHHNVEEMARYADVVCHAFPDASIERFEWDAPILWNCVNCTTVANLAYCSLHCVNPDLRIKAAKELKRYERKGKT